jgi:hypothetical protein
MVDHQCLKGKLKRARMTKGSVYNTSGLFHRQMTVTETTIGVEGVYIFYMWIFANNIQTSVTMKSK